MHETFIAIQCLSTYPSLLFRRAKIEDAVAIDNAAAAPSLPGRAAPQASCRSMLLPGTTFLKDNSSVPSLG